MPTPGSIAGPVAALINEFSKLPTVGPKTAARLVFYLLNRPRNEAQSLAEAILNVKDHVRFCTICYSLTENDPCELCTDERRDASIVCVVAEAKDVYAIERTRRVSRPLSRARRIDLADGRHRPGDSCV